MPLFPLNIYKIKNERLKKEISVELCKVLENEYSTYFIRKSIGELMALLGYIRAYNEEENYFLQNLLIRSKELAVIFVIKKDEAATVELVEEIKKLIVDFIPAIEKT